MKMFTNLVILCTCIVLAYGQLNATSRPDDAQEQAAVTNLCNVMDFDGNQEISETEFLTLFAVSDKNNDGIMTEKEFFLNMVSHNPQLFFQAKTIYHYMDVRCLYLVNRSDMSQIFYEFDSDGDGHVRNRECIEFYTKVLNGSAPRPCLHIHRS